MSSPVMGGAGTENPLEWKEDYRCIEIFSHECYLYVGKTGKKVGRYKKELRKDLRGCIFYI